MSNLSNALFALSLVMVIGGLGMIGLELIARKLTPKRRLWHTPLWKN